MAFDPFYLQLIVDELSDISVASDGYSGWSPKLTSIDSVLGAGIFSYSPPTTSTGNVTYGNISLGTDTNPTVPGVYNIYGTKVISGGPYFIASNAISASVVVTSTEDTMNLNSLVDFVSVYDAVSASTVGNICDEIFGLTLEYDTYNDTPANPAIMILSLWT